MVLFTIIPRNSLEKSLHLVAVSDARLCWPRNLSSREKNLYTSRHNYFIDYEVEISTKLLQALHLPLSQ